MWYKTLKMLKEPETIAQQYAITMQMLSEGNLKNIDERNRRDVVVDTWLETEKPKLAYVV